MDYIDFSVYGAIFTVIMMRSAAVYSDFVIAEKCETAFQRFMGWFRFYLPGFSKTLGCVAVWLSVSAFLVEAYAWCFGNAVFAIAAFIDFNKFENQRWHVSLRNTFDHPEGYAWTFVVVPTIIAIASFAHLSDETLGGVVFEMPGIYLLAVGFLFMKMNIWGPDSHATKSYLFVVLLWDSLLLTGALIDAKEPFIILEACAVLLDSIVAIVVLRKKVDETIQHAVQDHS